MFRISGRRASPASSQVLSGTQRPDAAYRPVSEGEMAIVEEQLVAQNSAGVSETEWEPKILVFLCSWCGYTGADQAGAGRIQYPTNVRIAQVPCAGRIDPLFVIKALQRGADGVLIAGCHPGNCHYTSGNYYARRRLLITRSLLEHVGIEPGRIRMLWLGASEGAKFARAVTEIVEDVKTLGPSKALVKSRI